jgi:hypothetical protein
VFSHQDRFDIPIECCPCVRNDQVLRGGNAETRLCTVYAESSAVSWGPGGLVACIFAGGRTRAPVVSVIFQRRLNWG